MSDEGPEGSEIYVNEDGIMCENSPVPQSKKPKVYLKPLPLDKLRTNGSTNVPLKALPVIGAP